MICVSLSCPFLSEHVYCSYPVSVSPLYVGWGMGRGERPCLFNSQVSNQEELHLKNIIHLQTWCRSRDMRFWDWCWDWILGVFGGSGRVVNYYSLREDCGRTSLKVTTTNSSHSVICMLLFPSRGRVCISTLDSQLALRLALMNGLQWKKGSRTFEPRP